MQILVDSISNAARSYSIHLTLTLIGKGLIKYRTDTLLTVSSRRRYRTQHLLQALLQGLSVPCQTTTRALLGVSISLRHWFYAVTAIVLFCWEA